MQRRAPAKLNLYLRVLGRRPDGYHELETLFERIDLADELTFQREPEGVRLTCDEPALPIDEENLVLKAARLLQRAARTTQGVTIHLRKRIPLAAGLGGGSSDAATTLLGLNECWQLRLSLTHLLQLAAQLGSDVPFFLTQAAFAIGRGRGEICEPLAHSGGLCHVLVIPPIRLSTKEIYEGLQNGRVEPSPRMAHGVGRQRRFGLTTLHPSISMVSHAISNGSLSELAEGMWNDLEPEAIRRCPVITQIQSQLHQCRCLATLVSGSGPTVVGLCRDLTHAQDVATGMRAQAGPSWRVEIVQTLHADGE